MERYEVGGDDRLLALVAAAERGEEAVFTRNGVVVAAVRPQLTFDDLPAKGSIDLEKLRALHESLPPGMIGGGAVSIRELRDMDEH